MKMGVKYELKFLTKEEVEIYKTKACALVNIDT